MEKLSELMDGELDSREASVLLTRLKAEPGLGEKWDLYHLVGDAIRKERVLASRIGAGVKERLAQEPTVLAPRTFAPRRTLRYAMSAAAGLAGVAVVAWVAFDNAPTQIAQAPVAAVAVNARLAPAPMMQASNDADMEDYLLAHQSVSSFRTMHGSLPYVRAAAAGEGK